MTSEELETYYDRNFPYTPTDEELRHMTATIILGLFAVLGFLLLAIGLIALLS